MSAAAAETRVSLSEIRCRDWAPYVLVLMDAAALELSLLLGWATRTALFPGRGAAITLSQISGVALGVLTLLFGYYLVGLYPGHGMGGVQRFRARTYSTVAAFTTLLAWDYVIMDQQWSRGVLLCTVGFALLLTPVMEAGTRSVLGRRGLCGMPVLILGAGKTGRSVAKTLLNEPGLGFVPIGILDDDPGKWNTSIQGLPVLGPLTAASGFQGQVKSVIVAMPGMPKNRFVQLIHGLSFANVIIVPDLLGLQSLWVTSRDLGGIIGLEFKKNLLVPSNRRFKRLIDYSLAVCISTLAAPVIGLCALWIKLLDPGPAFFRQQREGEDGTPISVLKLRTMYRDADALLDRHLSTHPEERLRWNRYFKLKNDPRVLPWVGVFLRRSSLDELPQLWNVLRGEMSLVGPRPFPYYHLEGFSSNFRKLRTSVRPGLTGLWQVSARSDGDLDVQEACDTYYIRNWSLWLDIYIVFRTVQVVVRGAGAY